MGGAGCSGDVLIHECAAEVVDAGLEELAYAVDSDFDPGGLNVVDVAAVGEATDGVHQDGLSERGPARIAVLKAPSGVGVHLRTRSLRGESHGVLGVTL